MTSKMHWLVLFLGVLYAAGFGLLGYGLWSARRSRQAAGWPTTPGTITQLDLKESSADASATYKIQLRYFYAVEGVSYQGTRLAFGYSGSGNRGAHDEIHKKLKEAREVAVRFDPADPAVSCLSYGLNRSIQIVLVVAVTWLAVTSVFALLAWMSAGNDTVLLENLSVK
jgi:hypothetical protein